MSEGQFEKILREYAGQWVVSLSPFLEYKGSDEKMKAHVEDIMEDILRTIDEARREFPSIPKLIWTPTGTIDQLGSYMAYSKYINVDLKEWAEKWFGTEEKEEPMKIIDLSEVSGVRDSGRDVSEGRVYVEKRTNTPHCKEHGAMNKVSKDGIWRCLTCHVGCYEISEEKEEVKKQE